MLVVLWRISLYLTRNLSHMFRTESTMLFRHAERDPLDRRYGQGQMGGG